jgi:hypothetical protein
MKGVAMKRSIFVIPLLLFVLILFALLQVAYGDQEQAAGTGLITGNVYCDQDKNGACDCEDSGLKDIHIRIFDQHCGGTALQTVSTDKNGNFTFRSFEPGTYFVMVDLRYVCGGRVPTTSICQQVRLEAGETVKVPAFGYSEYGQ